MGDVESLFGSPPASPSIHAIHLPSATGSYCSLPGRSTSPTTQSPHYGPISALRTTQNVGNIALSGSPNISKTTPSTAILNPMQSSQSQHQSRLPTPVDPSAASQSSRKQQKQPAKKSRSATSSPATGPALELPWTPYDVSHGPPKNYLRNQPALLGNAGVVGQVTHPFTPTGTRATNPIIVEAEPQPEPISLPPLPPPKKKQPKQPTPNATSTPSTTPDILATLRSNPKLVPLLKTLLNHIGSTSTTPRPASPKARGTTISSNPDQARPSKRRKLDRVPGGAENWDIPFPFKPGEGPPGYTEKWKSERGRKLLADLVNMLRVAVDKTAPPPAHSPSPSSSRRPSVAASSTHTGSSLSTPSTSTAPLPDVGFDVNDFLSLLNSVPASTSATSQPLGAFDFLSLFEAQDASGNSSLLSWDQPTDLDGEVCGTTSELNTASGAVPMQIDDPAVIPTSLAGGSTELNWLEGFTFPPPIPISQQPPQQHASSNIIIDPSLLEPPLPVPPSAHVAAAVSVPSPSPVTFEFAPPAPTVHIPPVFGNAIGVDVSTRTTSPSISAPSPSQGPSGPTPATTSSTGTIVRMPKTRKLEVLAAAKLKREAILEELNQAKMQRWECTIERAVLQGVLRRG